MFKSRYAIAVRLRNLAINKVGSDIDVFREGRHLILVSLALSRMALFDLAPGTLTAYQQGALRILDIRASKLPRQEELFAWRSPAGCRTQFIDALSALKAKLRASTQEKDVWHVEAPEGRESELTHNICGVFWLFEALGTVVPGLQNPFKVPEADRVSKRIRYADGVAGPTITPRFSFRIPPHANIALRTDSGAMLPYILPALADAGAPASIQRTAATQIEGLARISEEVAISVLDWWQSQFGHTLATPNKGDGNARTKLQVLSDLWVGEEHLYFDNERRELDPDGWGIAEWRDYLLDEKIPEAVRHAKATRSPLHPNQRGGFYSRSGYADYHYAPAMKAAGLPTRTHYPRHCGVNDFVNYVNSRTDLSSEEKADRLLVFARSMGWKWPEVTIATYSLPARQNEMFEVQREWAAMRRSRPSELLAAGAGLPRVESRQTINDRQLSRLARRAAYGTEKRAKV